MDYSVQNMIVSIILGIIIILIAVWNGLVIRWQQTGKGSRLWHFVGWIIRILITSLVYLQTSNVWWTAVAGFVSWIPYNIIISLIVWGKLLHLSNTGIDGLIRWVLSIDSNKF